MTIKEREKDMRNIFVIVILAAASVWLGLKPANAQAQVNDIDPANPPAGFWTGKPTHDFPKMDAAGKFQVMTTQIALVNAALIDSHDRDGTGTNQPHIHVKDEYDN